MYLGNSDELRQRIKGYNTGPSGNFIFNRRDLEPIGKTFRGTTPHSRNYEYVRDFAITNQPQAEDDVNSTNLKEEIQKVIQERSKPGDNLWNSTPQFIYFYLGLRTFLDNDTWILVKKSHLYLAAKNGSNLTQPALRFTEQTPIKVLDLWDLKNNFPNLPKNQPTLPKPEKKESREDLISKLKAEIETLKNISNKTPSQEKELKQKESYLRWLEDSNSSSNSDRDFTKTTTKSSLGNSLFLMVGLGIIMVGILLFLFIISKRKRKKY